MPSQYLFFTQKSGLTGSHHNDQGLRGLPMRSSLFPICCHLLPHPSCGSPVLAAHRNAGPVLVTSTHMQQVSERGVSTLLQSLLFIGCLLT